MPRHEVEHVDIRKLVAVRLDELYQRDEGGLASGSTYPGGRPRRRPGIAIPLLHRQEMTRSDARIVPGGRDVHTHRDLACDAPAGFNRASGFQGVVTAVPYRAGAGLCLKVYPVELFEDVFELVSDQFDRLRRRLEMNVGGGQGTILASENRSGVEIQRTSRQVVQEQPNTHVAFRRQPAALAPERRRPLPHVIDERPKHRMNLDVSGNGIAHVLSASSRRRIAHQFSHQHHRNRQQLSEKATPHLTSPGPGPCVREGGGKVGLWPSAAEKRVELASLRFTNEARARHG